ncbi:MAG: MFS transporter [Limnohabitans sp.]|nr:MFS transporter [Limnohabitans sp.]
MKDRRYTFGVKTQPTNIPSDGFKPSLAVAAIVLAQCLSTSLWFSPSGVADSLMQAWQLSATSFGWLLAATQLGFIAGTMAFAFSGAADRFQPTRIFVVCSAIGALANAAVTWGVTDYGVFWSLRFVVGMCLAGIYPLGMKMLVQRVGSKPAAALGWLVGMLTLGTAMPHGLRALGQSWPWPEVLLGSSALALVGAALVALMGKPPKQVASPSSPAAPVPVRLNTQALREVIAVRGFRASALGYFGHMWELYAFWSVLPWLSLPIHRSLVAAGYGWAPSVALISFSAIGIGFFGCVLGGLWSRRVGSARVAATALAASGLMCLVYPFIPATWPLVQLGALLFWGICVVADSPQFSAMSSQHAPPQWLGSALVLQNGVGFFITVLSILLLGWAVQQWGSWALWLLAPGPVLGLWAMRPLLNKA